MISAIKWDLERAKEMLGELPDGGEKIVWNDDEYIVLGTSIHEKINGDITVTIKVGYDRGIKISSKLRDKEEIREEASELLDDEN